MAEANTSATEAPTINKVRETGEKSSLVAVTDGKVVVLLAGGIVFVVTAGVVGDEDPLSNAKPISIK